RSGVDHSGGGDSAKSGRHPTLEPIACDVTPAPFTTLGLDPRLFEGIRDLGYVNTRPIQSAVIPLALGGHDLIACAETGSGKTAAFVVPTLQKLLVDGAGSPERLALQAPDAPASNDSAAIVARAFQARGPTDVARAFQASGTSR